MPGLSEVFGAKLYLSFVVLFVKILADFHYGVQVLLLAEKVNSFLVLISLLIETRCLLPIARVLFILSLFDQNSWIESWTISFFASMLLNQFICLIEFLKRSQQNHSFID